MSYFPARFGSALQLGTSRASPGTGDDLPPALAAAVASAANPEAALWRALGAWDLWQKAGALAGSETAAPPPPCDNDTLPVCPAAAEQALALLLEDVYPQLRGQWLSLLAARGYRLPPRALPRVLALGTDQRPLRQLIIPVLGKRGHWLARQNPDWQWVGAPASSHASAWEEGNLEQRSAALHAMRADDPAGTLQALQAVWPNEAPDTRAALLACLSTGLNAGDEAFLETALDDKRKEVRQAAQRLLATLPDSQLGQRMQTRLNALVRIEHVPGNGTALAVDLPPERDKAMLRDGIGAASWPGLGEKAGWLVDMLAAVAPSRWAGLQSAPDCLRMAAATEYQHALLLGWATALQRQLPASSSPALHAWFAAMARLFVASDTARAQLPRDFFALFADLPPDVAHPLLQTLADESPQAWGEGEANLLALFGEAAQASSAPWPAPLAHAIVARIRAGIASERPPGWSLTYALPSFALVFDPAGADAYERGWPTASPGWEQWRGAIDKFLRTIRFRHQLHHHFQESAA